MFIVCYVLNVHLTSKINYVLFLGQKHKSCNLRSQYLTRSLIVFVSKPLLRLWWKVLIGFITDTFGVSWVFCLKSKSLACKMDKCPHIDSISFLSDSRDSTLGIYLFNCLSSLLFAAAMVWNCVCVYRSIPCSHSLQGYSKIMYRLNPSLLTAVIIRNDEPHRLCRECHTGWKS